jgi:hypothetical protein
MTGIQADAMSYDRLGGIIATTALFSVSPGSSGLGGTAVAAQAATSDEPADIFVSSFGGGNAQLFDGNGVPSGAALGLVEPFTAPGDNVDGLDARLTGTTVYWSVDPTTAGSAVAGGIYMASGAADIFLSPPVVGYTLFPALYASSAFLGLMSADDIDAVVVFEDGTAGFSATGDTVFFSLAPGSPSLATYGASPADILVAGAAAGGGTAIFATAASLGLSASDNLDALDLVPEPGALVLWAAGLAALVAVGSSRRRSK